MTLVDPPHQYTRRDFIGVAGYAAAAVFVGTGGAPKFMRYDADARRVDITLVAAYDTSNGGYNFNGGSHGGRRITVPTGWRVRLMFVNRDAIRHSVVVVREQEPLPMRIARPALAGAASRRRSSKDYPTEHASATSSLLRDRPAST